jgi:glycosyltransferase involved in cell wall biosynthesis
MIELSIIFPVYYNEASLERVLNEFETALSEHLRPEQYELIFVDDGSPDASLEILKRMARDHSTVRIIKLARNFGQPAAMLAGLSLARGRYAAMSAADGQDPASLTVGMYHKAISEHLHIVIGTRETRDEPLATRAISYLFSLVMKKLALRNYPAGGFDCVLLSRRVYTELTKQPEKSPFIQGQVLWLGYPIGHIPYHRRARLEGRSKWTVAKKLAYLWDGLVGYSFAPIQMMSILGFLAAGAGFAYALAVLVARLVYHATPIGWAPLMIVLLFVSGVQMMMLGIIGQYLKRTLDETRPRPLFIIDEVIPSGQNRTPEGE